MFLQCVFFLPGFFCKVKEVCRKEKKKKRKLSVWEVSAGTLEICSHKISTSILRLSMTSALSEKGWKRQDHRQKIDLM